MKRVGYWVAMALWASAAQAQSGVYKCTVNGRTVFQDQPCAGAARASASPQATPVSDLIDQVHSTENAISALHKRHEVEQRFLRQKRETAADPRRIDAELAALDRGFNTEMAAAQRRRDAARAALRQRCPTGASLTRGQTTCFK